MRPINEWDEDYILNLLLGEHDWVEFKESRKLDFSLQGINQAVVLNELSKQISAFANSGGGAIVYGIEDARLGAFRKVDNEGGVSLNLKNDTKNGLMM